MEKMNFDQFKEHISKIPAPAGRIGIFELSIDYRKKRYYFEGLKENASNNPDLCGFGLNHYFNRTEQPTKESIFHDSEDVSIDIHRDLFVSAEKDGESINLKTKKWSGTISIINN